MQTTHQGRIYKLTQEAAGDSLRADLIARGWDGFIYHGFSAKTGRQRKDFAGIFYRSAKTGAFVSVL